MWGDSVQFGSVTVVFDSLRPHEPQHARPPSPSSTPGVHPNPCPLSQWCRSTVSSSVVPFSSCSQSFPPSGSFPMSSAYTHVIPTPIKTGDISLPQVPVCPLLSLFSPLPATGNCRSDFHHYRSALLFPNSILVESHSTPLLCLASFSIMFLKVTHVICINSCVY